MASQLSAQATTAQTAIARMSTSWGSHGLRPHGSVSPAKHAAKPSIMPLAPRRGGRKTDGTASDQRLTQLMREPWGEAALLADARLVHEPQLDPPGLGVPVRHAPDQVRQLFLKRSCALGSASGWTGRGFWQERASPLSSRLTPLSL